MIGVTGVISGGGGGESGGEAGSGGSSEVGVRGGGINFTEEDLNKAAMIRNMEELGDRSSGGGNRWPRQETIALLNIRSEMGVVFRDSSLKGPLWEDVSRKMAELGYHRSAKKCKEKFENVYKYHKRTKDGRASKSDGKTYRFFEQLEALENNPPHHSLASSSSRPPPPPLEATPINMAMPMPPSVDVHPSSHGTAPTNVTVTSPPTIMVMAQHNIPSMQQQQPPNPNPSHHVSLSYSTSSSTSSDEHIQRRHKKKRKWKDFFQRLMKDVIEKQEELQRRFLETLEKRERDRMVREEAWRVEEMTRMNREHDLLVQERSMAAEKEAAVLSFLQKITQQQNIQIPTSINIAPPPPSSAQVQVQLPPPHVHTVQSQTTVIAAPPPSQPAQMPVPAKNVEAPKSDNGGESYTPASSSRWPKAEVEALIRLRTNLNIKYLENGPKGPLWEEISAGMRKIGYNRNAKRCKEKWENINKYFKKVKESNKKRPEDSKTCPYFHQLDALYKEKAKNEPGFPDQNNPMAPIMARPEQQWPLLHQQESDNMEDEEDEDDEEHDENAYEIVTNKQQSSMNASTTTATTTV